MARFTVSIEEANRLVVAVVIGKLDNESGQQVTREARAAAVPRRFGLLYDVRAADVTVVQNADVFWWARNIPELTTAEARRVRAAVVHTPAQQAIAEFWENTYRNMGLQARAFVDEAEARRWLADHPPE